MRSYPAYKDSGVEWLGMVPEGWEVVPLKRRFSVRLGKMLQPSSKAAEDFEAPYLRAANIQWAGVDLNDLKTMWFTRGEAVTLTLQKDDLLVSEGGDVGRSAILDADLNEIYFQNSVNRVRAQARDCTRFLYYWMSVIKALGYVDVLCNKSTIAHFTAEKVEAVPVPLPPLPEQQAIAAFLDRETAKIDGLIEEQRRLIALLAEKRQATISHAVTRGMNPSAGLKPSGVDWLGDIPEGWEVVQLRRAISSSDYGISDSLEPDGKIAVLRMGNISDGRLRLDDLKYTNSVPDNLLLQSGDLLFNRTNSLDLIGKVGLYLGRDQTPVSFASYLVRLRLGVGHLPRLFAYLLNTAAILGEARSRALVAIGQCNLNPSRYSEIRIALPPPSEQANIVTYLDEQTAQLDSLTETATSAISLLQERRAALISAAVTGKIDVREVAKVPAQASQSLHVSAMVAGVIIARHGQHLGFGRMMVQKFIFMTQACANAPEIGGVYERQAAGPLDRDLQNRVEAALEAAGLVRVQQEGGRGSRVQYEFLGDAVALREELASALGDRMERFDYLSNQLGGLSKNGIEAVATLYAAWNDFLIDGRTPDRADIVREVLENWHPEKSRKFTADELGTWLDWMERQNIVPDGTGPQTQTGRLFP